MDNFQISDKPAGPWLQLADYKSAQQALDSARGNFQWPMVWVAKMRRLKAQDLLPPPEHMVGEMLERVSTLHGSNTADILSEHIDGIVSETYNGCQLRMDGLHIGVLVPDIKRAYGRDKNVRPADFAEITTESGTAADAAKYLVENQLELPTLEEANADLESRKLPLKDLLS